MFLFCKSVRQHVMNRHLSHDILIRADLFFTINLDYATKCVGKTHVEYFKSLVKSAFEKLAGVCNEI